ncbi:MAG: DUF6261 family protein [Tannerellaceae bacterium]|jgi:hypothetical protein|nr:DUF6261 family protein [Tannerellaceae bacterium]
MAIKSVKNYSRIVTRFRHGEHYDFHEYISDTVEPSLGSVPEVLPAWTAFKTLFQKEDIIYKKSATSNETKYVREAARRRIDIFQMFHHRIDSAKYSFNDVEKDSATKLGEILHNYKGIPSATMSEASALITNMIQDLAGARYATPLGKLGLDAVVSELEKANNEFREIYKERALNLEASEMKGTMKGIRVQVDKSFKLFTQALDVVYALEYMSGKKDISGAGEMIDGLNAIIDQFERILALRGISSGKKGGSDSADDEDTDEPEVVIPELTLSSQEVLDGKQMEIIPVEQDTFRRALYPRALDGNLHLTSPGVTDYPDFPITSFRMDGQTPVGIVIAPPQPGLTFNRPIYGMGESRGNAFDKDGNLLAVITGIEWPASYGS